MNKNFRTNLPDWSAAVPLLPEAGPRRVALYREIRRLIEEGALPPGAKLPTTRDLAGRFGLARGAAVAAYEMLVADGFAEARVGAGTYVARNVPVGVRALPSHGRRGSNATGPLPGALGCSAADERTLNVFRTLLNRHLARPDPRHYHYGAAAGGADLRGEIAAYLRTARGVHCSADQVIVTAGTQAGLDLVIRTLLKPGEAIWVENPCYTMARRAFAAAGLSLVGIPVDAEGMDVKRAILSAPQARAAYITPSHQFPLGVTLSMARRLALIDWARRADAYIIEDDYDSEYRFSGPPLASLQGIDVHGRVIYTGTFSKVLMPGFRVGYLVAPPGLVEPLLETRALTDRFPSTLAEGAIAELLREGHFAAHIRRARRRAREARDRLVEALFGSGLAITPPDQGLHLVADLPEGVEDAAFPALAAETGFGVRALSPMYLPSADGLARQGLVIGFSGFAPDVLAEAARRFAAVLRF